MSTKSERAKMKQLFEFNMMQLKRLTAEVKESPHDYNAYARMKYYEGICVGLRLAMEHGKR